MKQFLKLPRKLSANSQWNGLFLGVFLSFLFTGFFTTVRSQSCAGNFTVEASRTYDFGANTTTFTYKVTQTGAKHALSNFSFPLQCPEPGAVDIATALQGSVAETSYDGINWVASKTSYGKNPPAKSCYDGPVFKFDDGSRGKIIWFRLTLLGSWELTPDFAIIKYGQDCCIIDVTDGKCLTEACIPIRPGTLSGNIVCAPATGTISLTNATSGAKYQLVNTNGTASTADDVDVQVAKDGNNGTLTWTGIAAGTYYVKIYRVPADKCSTVTNQATVVINPLPVISCSANPTVIDITSAAHNTQMNVDLSGNADTDPTHYSYVWTEDGAGSFNFNNIRNPVYTAKPLDAGQTVSFTVTVTNLATGCVTSSNCSVSVNTAGSCPAVPVTAICSGSTNLYTADRAATANETWKWTVNNGASIVGADNGQSVSVKAGTQNFTLTLTVSYANTELSPTVCTYNVTVNPPTTASDPSDAVRCVGGTSVTFTTTAGGTGPFTYVWKKDNVVIVGATTNSYTVTGPITMAHAGTYTVEVTGVCGMASQSATLTVNPLPTVTANDASVCIGATVQLVGTPAGGTWSGANVSAGGLFNAAGLTAGTYVVTYSYTNPQTGCSNTDPATVTVNALTTATDPSDAVRCVGGASVTFTTTAGGTGPFTYVWKKDNVVIVGATTNSYTVTGPITMAHAGTYTVEVTGTCGMASQSATLTVNPLPTVTANDASVCIGATVQLVGTPAGGTWSGANVSASGLFNAAGLTAGTYVVTYSYTDPQTGCSNTDPATVTVNPLTTATDPSDAVRCVGGASVTFTTTAGGTGPFTYVWKKDNVVIVGATTNSYTVTGPITMAHAGTYTVEVTGVCGMASQSATLTVNPLPTVTANDASVCIGATVQLTGTPAGGTWSGANVSAGGLFNAAGLTAGAYVVTYSYTDPQTGCSNSDPATVTVNPLTTATDPSDAVRCVGGASVTFTTTAGGTGPFTYVWKKDNVVIVGATTNSYTVTGPITMAHAGTYTVEVTGVCGMASQSATLTVNPPTTASDPSDAVRCVGGASVTFTTTAGGTGPFTYVWKKDNVVIVGATTNSYTVTGPITMAHAGTYTVEVTGVCGMASQSATLTVNPLPTVTANDASVCIGATVQLTGTPAGGTWSGANVSASGLFNAAGLTAGAYVVTYSYTDPQTGCSNTDPATVTVNPLTTATDPSDAVRCVGGTSVTFTTTAGGTGPFTYVWKKDNVVIVGATTNSYTVTGPITMAHAGTYTVEVTGVCGMASQSATLTVNPLPTVTANDASVCIGATVQLVGTPAGGTWSGANVSAGGLFNAAGLTAGTYVVTYSYTNPQTGCSNTDPATVTVNALTTATDPSDAVRCVGGASVTFTTTAGGTGPFTYVWKKDNVVIVGATTNSYTVTGPITMAHAGTYTVEVTGTCGMASQSATLTVNPLPTVTANDASVCIGATVQLVGTPAGGTWSGANVSASGLFNAAGLTAGTYVVTYSYTDPQTGCSNTDPATVTVNPLTTATDPSDAVRCVGGASVTFTTTAGGTGPFTYVWKKDNVVIVGATTNSYTVTGPITMAHAGTYTVEVTGVCGMASQSATLTVNPLPVISCSATPTVIDITSAAHNTQMNVDLSGNADTDPTHYSYAWTEDGAGSFNFSNIKNPVYTAGPLDAGQVVSFTVTVTNLATGCVSTSNCSVTVSGAGSCPAVPTSEVCNGSTNTYTADRAPSANETWKWSVNNAASIVGADNGQSVTVKAGGQNFTLTLTVSYANRELSPTVCSYDVAVKLCAPLCSYTQGFWGNNNGLALLPSLLTSPITIGRPGQSVTIPAGSHVKLNSIMPGGGTPTGLVAGDCSILDPCFNSYLTAQGKINNNLLSQTIGVALAVRLNGTALSGLAIGSGCIVTSGGTFQINQNVVNYLGGSATIQDLLDLANDVLGGVKTPGVGGVPSYSDLNAAMDAINNGFDECRYFVGYCPTVDVTSNEVVGLRVSAYPNPFVEKVNFTITSPVSGKGSLEVYNMFGQKLQTVYEGSVTAGKTLFVEFRPNVTLVAGTLIYKFSVDGTHVTGKLINLKQ